jgi:hypothetical protein
LAPCFCRADLTDALPGEVADHQGKIGTVPFVARALVLRFVRLLGLDHGPRLDADRRQSRRGDPRRGPRSVLVNGNEE